MPESYSRHSADLQNFFYIPVHLFCHGGKNLLFLFRHAVHDDLPDYFGNLLNLADYGVRLFESDNYAYIFCH